jgi:sugar lactone lactonase YvrE
MTSQLIRLAVAISGLALTLLASAQSIFTPYEFNVLAGTGYIGTNDGTGFGAQFYSPQGVALDRNGNIYVADTENHTLRKVSTTGVVTTLAGKAGTSGVADGTGSVARFNYPWGVAVDSAGNIYVADAGNDTIRKVSPGGTVTTLAGFSGIPGSLDGPTSESWFNNPHGLAIDQSDNIYVADYGNGTIRKISSDQMVTTVAGSAGDFGSIDGSADVARFGVCWTYYGSTYCDGPEGIAVDVAGNLYVTDPKNNTIRKIATNGVVSTVAGLAGNAGSADGIGAAARFNQPEGIAVDSAGNLFVADSNSGTVRNVTANGTVTTLAGAAGTTGNGGIGFQVPPGAVGSGSACRFRVPYGIAVDAAGDLYLVDSWDNTVRKGRQVNYTPYTFTTIAGNAGTGSADGTGNQARFNQPWGLAADRGGNVYVSDYNNFTIRKISTAGIVTTLAGAPGISGNSDGTGNNGLFGGCGSDFFFGTFCRGPQGVAVDTAGNVYVADAPNQTIRKVTPSGVVTTLAGLPLNDLAWPSGSVFPPNIGATDGQGTAARFAGPSGLAADAFGNVFVADTGNHLIRKITPDGWVTTWAGMALTAGSIDGTNSTARFNYPEGVAADRTGNVYVADTGNHTIRKITPAGVVTTLAGSPGKSGSADGVGSAASFNGPWGLTLDDAGNIYVADTGNDMIRKITPAGLVTTLAGCSNCPSGSADGAGSAARFNNPNGIGVDGNGNIYVADEYNNSIRKVTPAGVVTTLAGLAAPDYSTNADGIGSTAWFSNPYGVAADNSGNVYVADADNNSIRKITPTGVVTTLAGTTGKSGSADGTNNTALFSEPGGVAVDSTGNIYVADTYNSTIRKVTADGVVTTLAGSASGSGSTDGTNNAARFDSPEGIAIDSAGILYVADSYNNTIRKVTPDGIVTTLAGKAGYSGSDDGTGSDARFSYPVSLALDGAGNVFVADLDYAIIRKVTPDGVVTTLAGCAVCPYGAFDGTGTNALFTAPWGIAVDHAGNVFVSDYGNYTIRRITPDGVVTTVAGLSGATGTDDGTGNTVRFGGYYFNGFFGTTYIGPRGMAFDNTGNLYVADSFNNTIRKGYPENVPSAISFSPARLELQGGQFVLTLTGLAGQLAVIEASPDLTNWKPIWTNTFSGVSWDFSSVIFTDPSVGFFPNRFYRARTP